eukprot:CAMPEP_0183341022 /NCGR_PEP_ID=MMETSP0164_2-20130417/7377_1 /TAXON_ID=221442 /ORGANISM="Coccolithus pelagicus ssp braarudi, Strain PLY182g" /LENGTH=222 /DNA_ID=CAMNT_0025511253 /DNA_START=136 /DNA_END=804 /DNA_ORIENTATION=-
MAGQAPLLVAYLNETTAEYKAELHELQELARAAHCLASGGIKVLLAGADSRAVFITSEDGIRQPALSLFIGGRRKGEFPGTWNSQALRDWIYERFLGVQVLDDAHAVADFPHKTAVAIVECLCSPRAVELNSALAALRKQSRGKSLSTAVSTSSTSLAQELGLETSEGLVVVGAGGLGNRPRFPDHTLAFIADELQLWLFGVLGLAKPAAETLLRVPTKAEL